MAGFVVTIAGVGVLLSLVAGSPSAWAFAPGLLLIGLGLGLMLTPSVNIVQSSFAEAQQGEISGLSRSVSNLGSCLGTAIAGTILVAGISRHAYGAAMIVLGVIGLVGLGATLFIPTEATTPWSPTRSVGATMAHDFRFGLDLVDESAEGSQPEGDCGGRQAAFGRRDIGNNGRILVGRRGLGRHIRRLPALGPCS